MSNIVEFSQIHLLSDPETSHAPYVPARRRTTADFRKLLSEMRQRPASQRAFLRKLLKRAAANGVITDFPVAVPRSTDPVALS
jgi:hypothetical protein